LPLFITIIVVLNQSSHFKKGGGGGIYNLCGIRPKHSNISKWGGGYYNLGGIEIVIHFGSITNKNDSIRMGGNHAQCCEKM
jgi:hypothetical protein